MKLQNSAIPSFLSSFSLQNHLIQLKYLELVSVSCVGQTSPIALGLKRCIGRGQGGWHEGDLGTLIVDCQTEQVEEDILKQTGECTLVHYDEEDADEEEEVEEEGEEELE